MCFESLEEFLPEADRSFASPCLKHFAFLQQDCGCAVSGCAISYETVIRYQKDRVRIEVMFAIPEIPFVTIEEVVDGESKRRRRHTLRKTGAAKQLIGAFEKHREKTPLKTWCNQLESGEFDEMFDALLAELARGIKPIASRVLQGDFSKLPQH